MTAASKDNAASFTAFAILSLCRRARASLRAGDRHDARAAIFALMLHEPKIPDKWLRERIERLRMKAIVELQQEFRAFLERASA
jgi:hypothetical protein